MGADLYIRVLSRKCQSKNTRNFRRWVAKRDSAVDDTRKKECQDKVSLYHDKMYERGYFRDSYNSSSLMWRLGLSWGKDICKMLDDKGNLTVEKAQELRDIVAGLPIKYATLQELKDGHCNVDSPSAEKEWNDYYNKKKQDFLDFLDEAIRLRQPIYCSC